MSEEKKSILVWGIHGVGKTSMINSLPHELEKLSKEDGIIFNLTIPSDENDDRPEVRFRSKYRKFEATQFHDPINLNLNALPTWNPQSAKRYNLVFVDDKGDEMRAAVDKTRDVSPDNNLIRSYLEHHSNGVIALFEYDGDVKNDPKMKYENSDLLINLLDVLSSRKDEVSLAICINKIDRSRQRWKDPKVFFEIVFENNWKSVQQIIKEARSKNVKIEFFVTSMVGYFRNGQGVTVPNFSGNDVVDGDILRPWNVAAPLFWILENIEGTDDNNWFSSIFKANDKKSLAFPKSFF